MAIDRFNKLKSSLNRGVTTISIKTSSSLEKAKIKTHIESIRSEIERMTLHAGGSAYEIWASGGTDYAPLEEEFAQIKSKKEEIAQLEQEYAAIDERDNQILGSIHADPAAAPEPAGGIICPNCGASYAKPARFCRKCGYKLIQDDPSQQE